MVKEESTVPEINKEEKTKDSNLQKGWPIPECILLELIMATSPLEI